MYTLGEIPLFQTLADSRHILIAGAGGGYDVFCGLPLYFYLRRQGKQVYLANLTFSCLFGAQGRQITNSILEVTVDSGGLNYYFPERYLCEWFRRQGEQVSVYCIYRTGALPIAKAYQALAEELQLDTVVLVDGGTDSLMRGDETGLGTPQEDMASIAAVHKLTIKTKILVCLGFGVDAYHGVCHAQFLESVAALTQEGAFLGAFSLLASMPEVKLYCEAAEYVFQQMPESPSIVSSSVISALEGHFGNYHRTSNTEGSKLWINPLMGMYWAFELSGVAKRSLYLEQIGDSKTFMELTQIISKFRDGLGKIRSWDEIPV